MGRILRETPFEELYVQPSAGDGGGAMGAALWAYHMVLGRPRHFVLEHAYWGEAHSQDAIEEFLQAQNISYTRYDDEEKLLTQVVEELEVGKVVGWLQGRFEWGPRALGNRSILADPRRADMKDIVNTKIKFREPFRPFDVKPEKREVLPAITHVDGTGRLQTVSAVTNPRSGIPFRVWPFRSIDEQVACTHNAPHSSRERPHGAENRLATSPWRSAVKRSTITWFTGPPLLAFGLIFAASLPAHSAEIDFEGLSPGEIVDTLSSGAGVTGPLNGQS